MQTGLIHRPAPAAIPLLADRVNLAAHAIPAERNWQVAIDVADPLGNDVAGNCVEVAALRSAQVRLVNAGRSIWSPSRAEALALYTAWSGYDAAQGGVGPGTDVAKAMAAWCRDGISIEPGLLDVVQWTKLDPTNAGHVKLAIELTGGALFSFSLPSAVEGAPAWNVTPGTDPGTTPGSLAEHRVFCGRFDADAVWGITWGMEVPISWAFVQAYALAADAVVSWDWFGVTGITPAGLTRETLAADMADLTTTSPS